MSNPNHRGHRPLLIDSVAKRERCELCKAERKRGEKWGRACPGRPLNKATTKLEARSTL